MKKMCIKKIITKFSVVILLLINSNAILAMGSQTTLCEKSEQVIFSCHAKKKIISVCASQNVTENKDYFQYRYGDVQKIDLIFPIVKQHPKNFSSSNTVMYSGGGGIYLRLNNETYSYIVYSGIGKGWEKAGVAVEHNGKIITNILCSSPAEGNHNNSYFEKIKIPKDNTEFEIP